MERLKRLFFVVLVVGMLFVGHAFGAEIKARPVAQTTNYETLPVLKIDSDPWPAYAKKLLPGEMLFILEQDISVQTQGGSRKWYRGILKAGYQLVVSNTGVVIRIYECGNPVKALNGEPLTIAGFQVEPESVSRQARQVVYTEPPVVYYRPPSYIYYSRVQPCARDFRPSCSHYQSFRRPTAPTVRTSSSVSAPGVKTR